MLLHACGGRGRCDLRADNELSLLVVPVPVERNLLHFLLLRCDKLATVPSGLSQRSCPCPLLTSFLLALLLSRKLSLGPRLEEEPGVGVVSETLVARVHRLQQRVECRIRDAIARVLPAQCCGQIGLADVLLVPPVDHSSRLVAHGMRGTRQEQVLFTMFAEQVVFHLRESSLDAVNTCADGLDTIAGLFRCVKD